MDNSMIWSIINKYFEDDPQALVRHQIESYNDFFKNGIFRIFKEKNPLKITSRFDESIDDYRSQCIMYLGGKDGTKIHFGKPVIYDEGNTHYMFPNEARLRNMTYGMTIHYDIEIEFVDILEQGEQPSIIGGEFLNHLDEIEYNDDDADDAQKNTNYKKELNNLIDETTGGGPKTVNGGPTRKKREKQVNLQTTPAISALLKEAAEKSTIDNTQRRTITIENIYLGKFPIMVQSDFCILHGLPRQTRFSMGECKNDLGGYFIIDGKEKTVVPQEKFADNMLYIQKLILKPENEQTEEEQKNQKFLYSAEIKSVSENVSKPIRTLSIKMIAPNTKYTNKNIVVNIPNVKQPVPLFIVFRALGIISDKDIITMCLLDLDKYENMVDLFIPSVHDAGSIMTQQTALKYIATLTKWKTISYAHEILSDYFLPHIGEINYIQKAYYLGYMVFRLLAVEQGIELPIDRDNFKYKRIELVGTLMYDLFREYYNIQQKEIHLAFEEKLYFNRGMYENNLFGLIQQNYRDVFRERSLEGGFKKAFKGNWGAYSHTKKLGVVQDLNRLSFNSMLSHLRKTNLPMDAGLKLVGPRVLHSSQWGIIDPIDTPDGGNIGLHKSLAITTYVTRSVSREPYINWLREKIKMKLVEECPPQAIANMTKIIINGLWAGVVEKPIDAVIKMKLFRRNALIPIYTSITFEIKLNTIFIYTDGGRLCRPIFYKDELTNKLSFDRKNILKNLKDDDFSWNDLITGFNKKKIDNFNPSDGKIYELFELYDGITEESNPAKLERFLEEKAIIDYIDGSESENTLIAMNIDEYEENNKNTKKNYTHCEIHESLTYGIMCNMINFIENNPPVRNSFSCGQSKQAVSMYHTNYQVRMDKTAVVLNYGQIPLVKTRFLQYINHEENPYGENAIVAIMCYTGYNVEDAILVNEGALNRGLFRTTYFSSYEAHEESSKVTDIIVDKKFKNIESLNKVIGTKPGYDYSKLDKYGLIRENTIVDDKTILIGMISNSAEKPDIAIDMSKTTKKGQLGIVDKAFITDGEEGERIAKIRIREQRIPAIGDKMASRAGQKGTIGLVIPECDMPFTKDGIRPDLIINPHALPSRMTIGQLIESITGKTCAMYGAFGECTAFNNRGSKIHVFGSLLSKSGFHSSGNEILYNGMTGEQIETEIFMGPTYYMRLKHMVKDKINYRALGPRTALTKQAVGGRANDGGLRIGEMERDSVISHGISNFLRESMMERGDKYFVAVCNQTGMLAIYNPSKNLFMSPMADGPIKFTGSLESENLNIENITRFGRSFSVISIPYSLKLLIHELQTMNIQMRIITEDNIQQLENMSYSKNIDKLMKTDNVTAQILVHDIKTAIREPITDKYGNIVRLEETSPENLLIYKEPETPPYAPVSPPYAPISPPYAPVSPPYAPTETELDEYIKDAQAQGSPLFSPTSPAYVPSSPTSEDNIQMLEEQKYLKGSSVYLRGDLKPNRIWIITNKGDKFITIQTADRIGLEIKDTIKIVKLNEIYSPEDVVNAESPYIPHSPDFPPPPPEIMGGFRRPQDSGFTFAPTIKVVNGNDNSITPVDNNIPLNPIMEPISGGNINNNNFLTNQPEIPNNNETMNEIDFNKGFKIKKI